MTHHNEDIIVLDNGYLIKLLHEHIPSLQLYGKDKRTDKVKWNSLAQFLKLIDYQLSHSLYTGEFELSQDTKRKKYSYNKYFSEYLHLHFYESDYIKEVKPRDYYIREFFKEIIYRCTKFILENKSDELFCQYEINISNPKISNYYPNIKFSDSLFYDELTLDLGQFSLEDITVGDNLPEKFKKIKWFDKLKTSSVILTQKKDVRQIYGYPQRKYETLEKGNKEVFTFDFVKSRKKIKKNNTKDKLNKYLHTNLILDTDLLKDIIINIINTNKDNIFLVFLIIIILNKFSKGDNYILYDVSKFRYLSKLELNNNINLQTIKKEYRKYIFINQYDYDINAGAPTLLYQYIKKQLPNENIQLQYLEKYIANRNIVRDEAIKLLKAKYPEETKRNFKNEVKALITAALYGSNILNTRSKVEMRLKDREYLHDEYLEFRNLIEDVEKLFQYYEEYLKPFFKEQDFIEMQNGKIELFEIEDGKKRRKKIASIASEFYFSLESQILKLIYDNYKEHISLLMHDGFIARIDIDTNILEKLVYDNLGYYVKYEKEKLEVYL